ncbi:MAG: pyridoxal-dependent decarboxylase, exosortase A system-associated [Sterolibacteriaceae bacterium]|nr:pyridoxal-dependent decarboxylase, exosortase A system-associated [Sterolibacteriaceae bacterium]MBK9086466.1 pyridoxal-dependent decarboxylase, exosortase A system-associated [Sterolibacteriaceae bacterium]
MIKQRDPAESLPTFGRDQDWPVVDGWLAVGGLPLTEFVQRLGSPCYLYSRERIDRRIAQVRAALPRELELLYPVKANPLPALLQHIAGQVDGFDIASGGELERALATGLTGARLSFAGPGKTDDELAEAVSAGALIVLESAGEAHRLAGLIGSRRPRVALRINPPFELSPAAARMGGGARKFGVDSEQAPRVLGEIARLPLEFEGFHCYPGSQCLDATAIIETQRATLDLAVELAAFAPAAPRVLNLGGGFGVPFFAGESPLDLARLGASLQSLTRDAASRLPGARLTLELGRFLVAEAGIYVCRVIERKRSRGKTILIVDGGLHHHWHASGALEGRRHLHFPIAVVIGHDSLVDSREVETVTVAGPLCAPHDVFAQDIELARAEAGDLVVIFQSGAYGATASPAGFLGRPPVSEMLI